MADKDPAEKSQPTPDAPASPGASKEPTVVTVNVTDVVHVKDRVEDSLSDSTGRIKSSGVSISDRGSQSGMSVDYEGGTKIGVSGRSRDRLDNLDVENRVGTALAHALGTVDGRAWRHEPKLQEDGDFPDVWLRADKATVVGIQVTHLDTNSVKQLGVRHHFRRSDLDVEHFRRMVVDAIDRKGKVDPREREKTILALTTVYPVHDHVRDELVRALSGFAELQSYRQVWVVDADGGAFRLT
jgi:hypothetical protein